MIFVFSNFKCALKLDYNTALLVCVSLSQISSKSGIMWLCFFKQDELILTEGEVDEGKWTRVR